jgi:DNA repair protein RecO (recombination protein O)
LAETLAYSLYEEEKNPGLYQYIETALVWLDTHERTSNFHILFLLNLTKYLGFYPETKDLNYAYFDLREGVFTNKKPLNNSVSGEKLIMFKSLIGINFDVVGQLGLNSRSRNLMLDILLDYYELHLPAFKEPKSLNVLKEVFR